MVEENLEKLNIVCSGGEMKGGFVSGVLTDLFKQIDMSKNDLTFYCVSASVPSLLYYLTYGTEVPSQQIWVEELSAEKDKIKNGFFKIDVDGIVEVFKSYPLSQEKILNSKDEIIFPIYNVDKKKVELVSNKKREGYNFFGDYDTYELVKAAISAPLIYGKTVKLGKYEYCDPGIVDHFIFSDTKNKTIFVLQNKNFRMDRVSFLVLFFYSFINKTKIPYFRFSISIFHKHKLYKKVKQMVKSGQAILLEPQNKLRGQVTKPTSRKDLLFNFKQGQKVFAKNKTKIERFLLK